MMDFTDFEDFNYEEFDNLTVEDILKTFIIMFLIGLLLWLVSVTNDYIDDNDINMYELEDLNNSTNSNTSNAKGYESSDSSDNVNDYDIVTSLMTYCDHITTLQYYHDSKNKEDIDDLLNNKHDLYDKCCNAINMDMNYNDNTILLPINGELVKHFIHTSDIFESNKEEYKICFDCTELTNTKHYQSFKCNVSYDDSNWSKNVGNYSSIDFLNALDFCIKLHTCNIYTYFKTVDEFNQSVLETRL